MSFLDEDQATAGRISLGTRRAGLESLLPRRRRQTARQQQVSGYDILPSTMQPIPGVVSTPTDIARVGVDVSQQLQQQGTTAAQVPNVFERYAETGAAPIGDFRQYLYPSPPTEEDEEEENDVIEATNEEFAENFGIDPYDPETPMGQFYLDQEAAAEAAAEQQQSVVQSILGSSTMPLSQSARAFVADITGSRAYIDSVFNYSLTGDVSTPPTAAQINESEFGPQGGGWGTAGAPGYTPPTAPQSNDPSVGDGGDDGGGGGGDGGTGFGTGGIEAAAAAGVFASGGIVTKSKTKNKTSFMSMKGK